jgi:DNA-binding CsgD family transcriptional regulator
MAGIPPTVLIALSDAERAEELEHAVSDVAHVVVMGGFEPDEEVSVVVTDGDILDAARPHIILGDGPPATNVAAVLPRYADISLVAATVQVVAAGYRVLPTASDEFGGRPTAVEVGEVEGAAFLLRPALTPRETETLALLVDGASNKVIARRLDISVHTAKFHVAAVLAKLHARNRADAVAIALRQGLVYV